MKLIDIEIEGTTPLMQHRMNEEALFGLLAAKQKKAAPKEELTPRQIADKAAYRDADGTYFIPTEYVVGAFRHMASDYKESNKSRRSLKTVAAGIFRPTNGKATLLDENNKALREFEVDIRKGVNHTKGAVAVCRPRFDRWKAKFSVQVDDSIISVSTAQQILEEAGRRAGIGSFRVSKGGYFGQFRILSWQEK
jgi:hypothetical protein